MPARRFVACLATTMLALGVVTPAPARAATTALTRNPYLTDATATSVRVNWATAAGGTANTVTWGPAGGGCSQYRVTATASSFTVGSTAETMLSARLGNLAPRTNYCYQIADGGIPVLPASIPFTTIAAPGDTAQFSFDVIGDTGYNGSGSSPDQDRLYSEMAGSGAAFVLTTGDMAYPDGSQNNYGDLANAGPNVSAVFGPAGWSTFGESAATFPVLGNHGRSGTFLQNWPTSDVVSASNGNYAMVSYPGQSGASNATYPTDYYAFDVGLARFYVLDADWTDSNVGTSTLYGQDYANHWSPGAAEYEWLKADLAAHPGGLKFATFHFPLHSDNATETSDTYLQGASSLEGLLAANNVDIAFNGHAHMYERNALVLGRMVSYVTGGGGGVLEPTGGNGCTPVDLYSIGWSPTSGTGSRCGTATAPVSPSQAYHFLHVTVSGSTVTVAPTNALGQTFDVVTYTFQSTAPSVTTTTAPTADTFLYQGAPSTSYGTTNPLLSSAGSYRSLLRFDTSRIDRTATVSSVTLRLYSTVGLGSGGVEVHPESDAWDEATTWSNQPAWNPSIVATSTTPTSPGWVSIRLPSTSITAGGNTDVGLSFSVAQNIERIASREDPGNAPQLVVTTAPAPLTTTLAPTADTFVYQGAPSQTNGSTTPLLASAGSYRALLRFDTGWIGPGATVSAVTLRLYATVALPSGGVQVRAEGDAWDEASTSWSSQPLWNSQVLATSGTPSTPGWISISLPTAAVTPGASTGFGLSYSVAQMIERITSRESPGTAPQLMVTTS
jgi:Calcineurin-like phosphoesterase/Purple acid Phosphatase, N-terminal domain